MIHPQGPGGSQEPPRPLKILVFGKFQISSRKVQEGPRSLPDPPTKYDVFEKLQHMFVYTFVIYVFLLLLPIGLPMGLPIISPSVLSRRVLGRTGFQA